MTKLKNTKKGMAKKALSISLVAAMLATSNVPVWAAEDIFSDGSDVAVETGAEIIDEVPVEADIFSSEEAATPVVEEAETPETLSAASSGVYDDSKLAAYTTPEWGHKIKLPEDGILYTEGGRLTETIISYWTYNGNQLGDTKTIAVNPNKEDSMNAAIANINDDAPTPTKAQCVEKGEFGLNLVIWVNGSINFSKNYNFGAAKAIDLTAKLEKENAASKVEFADDDYNNKEHKPAPTLASGQSKIVHVDRGNEDLGINDFSWDYVRPLKATGENDLISADDKVGQQVSVYAEVIAPGYTGSFTKEDAFTIEKKNLKTAENGGQLEIKLTKKAYEFTGSTVVPNESDVTFKDTETGDDLSSYILDVKVDDTVSKNDGYVGKGKTATVTLAGNKAGVIRNYDANGEFTVQDEFEVIKRDLSKCTVALTGDYSQGELEDMRVNNKSFDWGTQLKIYDADHKELGRQGMLYSVITNKVVKEGNDYYIVVEGAKGNDVAAANIANSRKEKVNAVSESLRDCKVYFKNEAGSEGAQFIDVKTEYTAEPYILTKDDIIVRDYATSNHRRLSDNQYTIECDQNTDAGIHWIQIKGAAGSSYEGSVLTLYYTVNPAKYDSHTLNEEVVINEAYTSASSYAEDIALQVVAKNNANPAKSFTLKPEDLNVKYTFGNKTDKNGNRNTPHNKISVEATIINKNYLATFTPATGSGVVINSDGTVTITEDVELVHPSIQDANVEIIGDYTFNGHQIIPDVKVTAANGTILKAGTDYRLDVKHGLHAGQAEVVITALKDGPYEEGSVSERNFFTIKPADISQIKATKEFTYIGEAQTPTIADLALKLNTADMAEYFNGTYPKDYKDNVNAGTATVTLTVKDQWKDDFTASSADVAFTIKPAEITADQYNEGIFTVYADNGHILNFTAFEGFQYDGTAKTFKDAKYDNTKITLNKKAYTLKKGTDYTIEYASNINPDKTGKDDKTAYVYVKLSPNFMIDNAVKAQTITTQDGDVLTNVLQSEKFRVSKVSVEKTAVSVTNPVYNLGRKVAPTVVVTLDGKTLEEGRDYELVYSSDETYEASASDAKTVTVKGINGYVASEKTAKWGIDQKDIAAEDITVTLDKGSYKPGEEPKVTVLDGKTIIDAEEYTVAYTDKEAGLLTITAAEKNYKGVKEVKYEIAMRADLADAKISAIADMVATGEQLKPEITVTYGNVILTEDTDYTVAYGENVEPGIGTVTITAVEGNATYQGTQTVEFNIVERKNLADAKISAIADMETTGEQLKPEIKVTYGNVILTEDTDYIVTYGENIEPGVGTVTITAVEGNTTYQGTQTVEFNILEKAPEVGTAVIDKVVVTNNKANIILSGDADKAIGYDYVVSTVNDYKNGRVAFDKNQVATQSTIQYLPKGNYYAYLHAWKRDENGKKVFGAWSNIVPFTITTTTPAQPLITKVTVKGSTVTVSYTKTKDATGYDLVLGSRVKKVNGESRPVEYGKLVKKVTKGNVVTATFKNVPKGTYYAGLHAYNRTGANNSKVFSPWSNSRKVTVK